MCVISLSGSAGTKQTPETPVVDLKRPCEPHLTGQASAGHNGQGQVKQLSAVIWKWSLWAVNTVVSSRSVCAALPRHIIVNSRQHALVLRCT